jgi:hypothetical protein
LVCEREEREREREARDRREEREFELQKLQLQAQRASAPINVTPTERPFIKVPLPQWDDKVKIEKFLETCERLLSGAQVPSERWTYYVLPKLPEKARQVYNDMPAEQANNYALLKKELLDRYAVSPLIYRKNFFGWVKRDRETYLEFLTNLQDQMKMWMQGAMPDEKEPDLKTLLLQYRLDQNMPEEIRVHLMDKGTRDPTTYASLADDFVFGKQAVLKTKEFKEDPEQQKSARKHKGQPCTPQEPSENARASSPKTEPGGGIRIPFCDYCQKRGHGSNRCFADPKSPYFRPRPHSSTPLSQQVAPFSSKQKSSSLAPKHAG